MGMIGRLPSTAWVCVLAELTAPAILALRLVCRDLLGLVGVHAVGRAGAVTAWMADKRAQLEAAETARLGRALVVQAWLSDETKGESELLDIVAAAAVAVRRGHMIWFVSPLDRESCSRAVIQASEAMLVVASRNGQLLHANLVHGEVLGWSVGAMAQLSSVTLSRPERETMMAIAGAGALRRASLSQVTWADLTVLSALLKVEFFYCRMVSDLGALANVSKLVVVGCTAVKTLPAMWNDWLEVGSCQSLTDLSGLAGGRVGLLKLWCLDKVDDVSAVGAMMPRTVILEQMGLLRDVSMLVGVKRLEVSECAGLDKVATLAVLRDKVETVHWDD